MSRSTKKTLPKKLSDFSLVSGGPLYQLWRRAHLSGDALQMTRRRIIVAVLLAWVPLLLLSVAEGHAWGRSVALTFLQDVEMHVRLLIALPLFIAAEITVHRRLPSVVGLFLERGLIPDAARPQFDAAVDAALRLRNSVTAELLLIAFVYGFGVLFVWRTQWVLDVTSWYGVTAGGTLAQPSLAGWWAGCVSMPLVQFLMLRWYFRLFIWGQFLWRVSRVELNLMPAHPDGAAGLGFLSKISHAYSLVLMGQGAVLAGMMANRIFYTGANLLDFKLEIAGTVGLMMLAVLGPQLVFAPKLRAIWREGKEAYGTLAQRYVREFDRKWLRGGAAADEPLVGSADIQSLADLRNSYAVVEDMRWAPFTLTNVLQLAVTTLLPVAPLLLTMFSIEELLDRMLKMLF
jgi:hypothetical protein